MRYRTSGLLAWVSLAIIVGVPTTETLLSKQNDIALISKNNHKPNDVQFLVNEMEVVKAKDKPLTLPIPIEFSLAGEQELLVSEENTTEFMEDLQTPYIRVVGDVGQTIGSNINTSKKIEVANNIADKKANDIIYDSPQNSTPKAENGIDEDFLRINTLKEIPQDVPQETLQETPVVPEIPTITKAPIIAVIKKEIAPVVVAKKYKNIIRIENTNTPQKLKVAYPAKQKLQKVNFYDLMSAKQKSGNKANSRFLEVINVRSNNVFMSKGSFISQLPPTRGSKIRLDLVN